mmetsp:Transcript_13244/g.36591  ORF Transcript_13244/g.36591 Transcript_13244/m.36591 type:complete len:210 (+) Transcript_13244:522-1151(+)
MDHHRLEPVVSQKQHRGQQMTECAKPEKDERIAEDIRRRLVEPEHAEYGRRNHAQPCHGHPEAVKEHPRGGRPKVDHAATRSAQHLALGHTLHRHPRRVLQLPPPPILKLPLPPHSARPVRAGISGRGEVDEPPVDSGRRREVPHPRHPLGYYVQRMRLHASHQHAHIRYLAPGRSVRGEPHSKRFEARRMPHSVAIERRLCQQRQPRS